MNMGDAMPSNRPGGDVAVCEVVRVTHPTGVWGQKCVILSLFLYHLEHYVAFLCQAGQIIWMCIFSGIFYLSGRSRHNPLVT